MGHTKGMFAITNIIWRVNPLTFTCFNNSVHYVRKRNHEKLESDKGTAKPKGEARAGKGSLSLWQIKG